MENIVNTIKLCCVYVRTSYISYNEDINNIYTIHTYLLKESCTYKCVPSDKDANYVNIKCSLDKQNFCKEN